MTEVTISVEEYKELLKKSTCIEAFAHYVNKEKYSIGREMCGIFLGFEVEENAGEN